MEVLHGDIRITLSDADAIRGMQRTKTAVERGLRQIAGKKAEVYIEGNLKDLRRSLKEAKALVEKNEEEINAKVKKLEAEREKLRGSAKGAITRQINAENRRLQLLKDQVTQLERQESVVAKALESRKRTNKEHALGVAQLKEEDRLHEGILKAIEDERRALQRYGREQSMALRMDEQRTVAMQERYQREGKLQAQAMRMDEQRSSRQESEQRALARLQQQALDLDIARTKEAARLQIAYNKANQEYQKMNQRGRAGRLVSPTLQQEFDLKEAEVLGEMAILRAKLEAMGEKPVDIRVNLQQGDILRKLAGIGDIGMRLGPFTGTLRTFTLAALALGPILTGLVGATTALGGALAGGLTAGLGIAATGLVAFGGALGVAFAGIKPAYDDLAGIIKRSKDYNNKVAQYGKSSDEAGKSLEKLKHIMGDVDDATLESLINLRQMGRRWREMTSEIRPDFFQTIGVGITSLNRSLPMLARHSNEVSGTLFQGLRKWSRGLSSVRGQGVINSILGSVEDSLPPLMGGIGKLGAALGKLTASFGRYFEPLLGDFEDWADGLNKAADNTDKLDRKVDRLMGSFGSTLNLLRAFGSLLMEVSSIAMGPGGSMMDSMADGLDRITQGLKDDPTRLRDFFEDSIDTVSKLFGVLKPLMGLFMEFSTILRPLTNIALDFTAAIASLFQTIAGSGVGRALATAALSLWFLKRASLTMIGLVSGALHGLAAALTGVGAAATRSGMGNLAGALGRNAGGINRTAARLGGTQVVTGRGPVLAPGSATATTTGRYAVRGGALVPAGAAAAAPAAANMARSTSLLGRFGAGLSTASRAILGVSGPVALLGAATVGAVIGIKKLAEAAANSAAQTERARKTYGPGGLPDRPKYPVTAGKGGIPSGLAPMKAYNDERRNVEEAARMQMAANTATRQSIALQRQLVDVQAQRVDAALNVEMAEKAYADAVKNSGKNSLEARAALQQLRSARRDETEAINVWRNAQKEAAHWANTAVEAAKAAYNAAKGTHAEDEAFAFFEKAKDNAEAFRLAVARARRGLDAFTGEGATKLGHFVRQFADIPGFKKLIVQAETQDAAMKIAKVVDKLDAAGKKKIVAKILADTKDPEEALRRLRAALQRYEDKPSVATLKADKRDVEEKLSVMNLALAAYGKKKPEALLKARDEAKAKLDRLMKQLDEYNKKVVTARVKVDFNAAFNASPGSDAAQGDGWGAAPPNIGDKIQQFAQDNKNTLVKKLFMGGLGMGGVNGSGLNAFNSIAQRFGLTVGSGFRANAITNAGNQSYHALGRARDFPGPPAAMMKFARFMAAAFGGRLKELIYTPLGFSIKNGRRVPPYAQADHYDHVHVAMATGGRVGPEKQRSGRYTQPTVLFSEEPRRPEYFISTNPRDRKRSRRLISEAAAEVGMIEHTPVFDAQAFSSGGRRGLISRIMSRVLKRAPGLSDWNKIFPTTFLDKANGKTPRMPVKVIRALAEAMGFSPTRALHMSQIARGESSRYPGIQQRDPGDGMVGYGLLQMTPNAWGAKAKTYMAKLGGINAMKNPILNMAMAKFLSDDAASRGADPLSPWYGTKFLRRGSRAKGSVLKDFQNRRGGKGGGKATMGGTRTLGSMLAKAQARYDLAQTTPEHADDLAALTDRPATMRDLTRKEKKSLRQRIAALNKRLRSREKLPKADRKALRERRTNLRERLTKGTTVDDPGQTGLISLTRQDKARAKRRLRKVNKLLKGPLTPQRRKALLAEKEQLIAKIGTSNTTLADLTDQRAEARFESGMEASGMSQAQNAWRKAQAEGTGTLDDDIVAAKYESEYWREREKWAIQRNDMVAATEARTNWQAAVNEVKNLQDQAATNLISYMHAASEATMTLSDDLNLAYGERDYWSGRVGLLLSEGDFAGAAAAQSNVNAANDSISRISEDMVRLPLERDRAFAALTDDINDDKAATQALRDYWQTRLDAAKASGDIAGQIEAATNVKTYADELKAAEADVVNQYKALNDARLELYKSFTWNFTAVPQGVPYTPPATPQAMITTVNIEQHFQAPPPEPLVWAQGTALDLKMAI